jgi:hypothetical protein
MNRFTVLFDPGLGEGIEIGQDLGPRARLAEVGDAVLQRLLQHQGEEA